MKLKKLILAASVAAALSTAAFNASAASIIANPVSGTSFSDLLVGTIHVGSLSDLTGSLFAASSVTFSSPFVFTLTLDSVTFTSGSVGSLVDLDGTAAGFSFKNVVAGDYLVKASGTLAPTGQYSGLALVGANYSVTAVPEPESYAMLLAGLGLMGTIARRRSKSKSV